MTQLLRSFGGYALPLLVLALIVLSVVTATYWFRAGRRFVPGTVSRSIWASALIVWAIATAALTLTPQYGADARTLELVPLQGIIDMLTSSVSWEVPLAQIGGNLFLFFPFGMIMRIGYDWRFRRMLGVATATVLLVEAIQYAAGLGRIASVNDAILALLGAAAGYGLGWLLGPTSAAASSQSGVGTQPEQARV